MGYRTTVYQMRPTVKQRQEQRLHELLHRSVTSERFAIPHRKYLILQSPNLVPSQRLVRANESAAPQSFLAEPHERASSSHQGRKQHTASLLTLVERSRVLLHSLGR